MGDSPRRRRPHAAPHPAEYPPAPLACGDDSRRRPLRLGLPAADVFPQSNRRALRPRHLVRGQVHGRGHDDPAAQPGRHVVLRRADRSGLCRRDALNGLCPAHLAARPPDEPARRLRRDDRLYLLRADGLSRHVCRRQQHCQPAQLVPRLLLRHELGQCPHDGRGLRQGPDPDVPALQAPPGLSAGRGLRAESRRAAARVPRGADLTFQCALRLRHGLCRPDLLRRHRRAAPDEVPF